MWSSLLHITYTYVSLLYLCRQREQCNCDLLSEIYKHMLFTSYLNFTCLLPPRLSCVLSLNTNELGSIRTYFKFMEAHIVYFLRELVLQMRTERHIKAYSHWQFFQARSERFLMDTSTFYCANHIGNFPAIF